MHKELGITKEEWDNISVEDLHRLLSKAVKEEVRNRKSDILRKKKEELKQKRQEAFKQFQEYVDGCEGIRGYIPTAPGLRQPGVLFENGAFIVGDSPNPLWNSWYYPSGNEFILAKMKREFLVMKIKQLREQGNRVKRNAFELAANQRYAGITQSLPNISSDHVKAVEQIKDQITELQERIKPLDEILGKSPEAEAQRKRAEETRDRTLETCERVNKLNQINL